MSKHNDDDPVLVEYSSFKNITFNNRGQADDLGYTWSEWRELTATERKDAIDEYLYNLVEVVIIDDEEAANW